MIPPRTQSRIVRKSDDLVLYASTPVRRIMFFVLFLMLASAMVAGFDMETDVSGLRLLKTGGYAAVLLVLLGAVGWAGATSLDRGSGNIETISRLFGVTVRRRVLTGIDEVDRVVLQKVVLLQDGPPGGRRGVLGNLFEPRAELLRLFLETSGGKISLDEGSNAEALEQTAVFFAEFLGVEFSQEELEP